MKLPGPQFVGNTDAARQGIMWSRVGCTRPAISLAPRVRLQDKRVLALSESTTDVGKVLALAVERGLLACRAGLAKLKSARSQAVY